MNGGFSLKWFIIIGITIVTNILFNYSISVYFEKPVFENICPSENIINLNSDQETCQLQNGEWLEKETKEQKIDYCSNYKNCLNEFEKTANKFEQKIFFVLIILGILLLIISLIVKIPTLSIAFSLTAVVNFIFASIRYWEYSDDLTRISILIVTLLTLILIAITRYIHSKNDGQIQS